MPAADGPEVMTMEVTNEAPGKEASPPHPSAAFPQGPATHPRLGNPWKKKNRKRHKPKTVPALQQAAASSSTSRGPRMWPSTARPPSSGPPTTRHLAPADTATPANQPEDDQDFQTVQSKAAHRRIRDIASAALPVDPAVVGTVLYRPAAAGSSFRSHPRLSLAQALTSRPDGSTTFESWNVWASTIQVIFYKLEESGGVVHIEKAVVIQQDLAVEVSSRGVLVPPCSYIGKDRTIQTRLTSQMNLTMFLHYIDELKIS
ncbi:hypothetical protein MTO96_006654 [Rhipicephalus appendiculatus]